MMNVLILRVQVIENHISVAGMTSGEDYNLKLFRKVLKNFNSIRPNVDASFNDLPSWKCYGQFNIIGRRESIITVYECLIQIKNYTFLI